MRGFVDIFVMYFRNTHETDRLVLQENKMLQFYGKTKPEHKHENKQQQQHGVRI